MWNFEFNIHLLASEKMIRLPPDCGRYISWWKNRSFKEKSFWLNQKRLKCSLMSINRSDWVLVGTNWPDEEADSTNYCLSRSGCSCKRRDSGNVGRQYRSLPVYRLLTRPSRFSPLGLVGFDRKIMLLQNHICGWKPNHLST